MNWPASRTAGQILDRAGLVGRRKSRRDTAGYGVRRSAAGEWTERRMVDRDFKNRFRTEDGVRDRPMRRRQSRTALAISLLVCQGLNET